MTPTFNDPFVSKTKLNPSILSTSSGTLSYNPSINPSLVVPVYNPAVVSPYNPAMLSPMYPSLALSPTYIPSIIPSIYIYPNNIVDALKVPQSMIGDVCNTENIIDKITKIIYYKVLDKWLYDDLSDILGYFKMSNGKVELIKNLQEKSHGSKDDKNVDDKVDFIEKQILSRDDVHMILKKFTKGTNMSWCEIPKNDYFIKETMEKYLIHKIEKLINLK